MAEMPRYTSVKTSVYRLHSNTFFVLLSLYFSFTLYPFLFIITLSIPHFGLKIPEKCLKILDVCTF